MHDNKIPPRNELLTEKELAELWGIGLSTIQHWRCATGGKIGPRFYKIGFRVFYHVDDIVRYTQERFFQSTNERIINSEANDGE